MSSTVTALSLFIVGVIVTAAMLYAYRGLCSPLNACAIG
jgi:hypothetical protein